jgi:2-polyprenyl-3-methyl-5-hydroxy-6-metoxy-1,4-benzoquinol methylase
LASIGGYKERYSAIDKVKGIMSDLSEKKLQETFTWNRTLFGDYNQTLVYYQALSCLENSRPGSLLDLACGEGIMTAYFFEKFKRLVGVDAASIHLNEARKRMPTAEFHESLIEEFKSDEKFDNVFLLMILEHVQDPVRILKKAASFLKLEGTLIVHVPNANAMNRRLAVKMGTLLSIGELSPFDINVVGHRRSYTLETLKKDIEDAGLRIKKTGGIFYKMLSTPQMDWFLKNGQWESGHGWGRSGVDGVDWKAEFCTACYEIGKEQPEDCNVIYAFIECNNDDRTGTI